MRIREQAMRMVVRWPRWRGLGAYGLSVTVLIAIAVLFYRLAFAPIHGVPDVAACARAYAEAETRQDTVSVDFLSYPDPAGHRVDQRCGYLRAATVDFSRR